MITFHSSGIELPTGTVTFLFTDIQDSTPLWERHPVQMAEALQIHNSLLRQVIEDNGGVNFKTVGDSFQTVFTSAPHALKAAIEGQKALEAASWNELGALKVRMGLHTGEAEVDPGGDEYLVSHTKNRAARIMSAAHGGQILLSAETARLVERFLPPETSLKDLGDHFLKGMTLPERLYQVLAIGLRSEFPHLTVEHGVRHNLPVQLTRFVGREKELRQLKTLLAENRLVTLTGAGGVGKTRLSLQVVSDLLDEFPNGAWFIELAPLGEESQIVQELADVLGIRPDANRSLLSALIDALKNKQLVLMLDNCEHLIEGCAELADTLLRSCPQVRILASSREALGVDGEVSFHVPSLDTPDPQHMPAFRFLADFEAVQLFLDRAQAISPGFALTESNSENIARLCQRLDGIPLALELAAARLRVLSVEQISERLDDRFRLLTGGSRRALPRHQTLQALIDWSYGLLKEKERVLFRRLSVFSGGWTLNAAEQVCSDDPTTGGALGEGDKVLLQVDDILDILEELVTKSMVVAEACDGKPQRYRMLETIRQYAQQKLVEADEAILAHDRHLDFYKRYAEDLGRKINTSQVSQSLKSLDAEKDNFSLASNWSLDSKEPWRVANGLMMNCALEQYLIIRGSRDSYEWCLKAIQALPEDDAQWFRVQAESKLLVGKFACILYGISTDPSEAERWLKESVLLFQLIEDDSGVARAKSACGFARLAKYALATDVIAGTDDYLEAVKEGEQGLTIARKLNQPKLLLEVLIANADIRYMGAEYAIAREFCDQSIRLAKQQSDLYNQWYPMRILGDSAYRQGDFKAAQHYYQELTAISQDWQSDFLSLHYATTFGIITFLQEEYDRMSTWFQRALSLSREIGVLINQVFSLRMLSIASLHQGQPAEAKCALLESLELAQSVQDEYGIRAALVVLAGLSFQEGQDEQAMQLLGAVEKQFEDFFKPLDPWEKREFTRLTTEGRRKMDKKTFITAWKTGRQMSFEEAILLANSVGSR